MLSYGGGVAVLATVTLLASSLASGVAEAATAQPATATVSARAGSSIVTRPSAIATPKAAPTAHSTAARGARPHFSTVKVTAQGRLPKNAANGGLQTGTITFSEFPEGTSITNQYQSSGIIFGGDSPFVTGDSSNPTSPVLS